MTVSHRVLAGVAALAVATTPVAANAATSTTPTTKMKAVTHCKALEKKDGKTKFAAKYGAKSALKKCEAAYIKAHKATKK